MMNFQEQIEKLIDNRELGSKDLLIQIFEVFERDNEEHLDEYSNTIQRLHSIHPNMVIVHHFLDCVSPYCGENLMAAIREYKSRWDQVDTHVANTLFSKVNFDDKHILTHSNSGAIFSVVKKARNHQKFLQILQTISEPGGEGRVQAQKLIQLGAKVRIIADVNIEEALEHIDFCLLGVDHFSSNHFVNKVGSLRICERCEQRQIPVYVLGDSRKEIRHPMKVGEIFESVPFTNSINLITESGWYHSSEV